MSTQDKILKWARRRRHFVSQEVAKAFRISRQAASRHLANLMDQGHLSRIGSTRGAQYTVHKPPSSPAVLRLVKQLKGLEEDRVFEECALKMRLKQKLNQKGYSIFSYAFTEMLNNAIDHSRSKTCRIEVAVSGRDSSFSIRDFGIGAYRNVMQTFSLDSEFEALQHLFKGKQTTWPQNHSGEGIFFTSRIADRFVLRSHTLQAIIDNLKEDVFVSEQRHISGTEVQFYLKNKTKKDLAELFNQFTNEDFEFDKNRIRIKITQSGGSLTRSQAKRLLFGLEKFSEIVFDFKGVQEIGQGFADEIFRVYANQHPNTKLLFENTSSVVSLLISRAIASQR